MTWSLFVRAAHATKNSVPAGAWMAIIQEGLSRYKERLAQGYADEPLYFGDLIERLISEEAR